MSFFGNPAYVGEFFEPEPSFLKTGIQITNLRKVFHKKAAVEDLSLKMYEDQITVLLGHNGAGKTTVMSMLTGMITPTSGTATVNGFDIRTEMDGVRESLGLCPQHNIIFDELTVEEHLYFFSKLKGLSPVDIKAEINKYVELLELEEKVIKFCNIKLNNRNCLISILTGIWFSQYYLQCVRFFRTNHDLTNMQKMQCSDWSGSTSGTFCPSGTKLRYELHHVLSMGMTNT